MTDTTTATATADAARTWTVTTETGFSVSGHLPPWATEDPSRSRVPIGRLGIALSDINHHQDIGGQFLRLLVSADHAHDHPADATSRDHETVPVFSGSIDCDPFAAEPERRVPVFNLRLVDDYTVAALAPDGVAQLAEVFRAQADMLDHQVRPALIAAREDWAAAHRPD